jgi:TPP-dependent indolepyruvate ferredoxin oxidoreductase alpha subunit
LVTDPKPAPRARVQADHRPERDPACAGCPQLGLLRALRRFRVAAEGRLGCEPGEAPLLAEAARGEARLLVLAGPDEPAPEALAAGAARVARVHPGDLQGVEAAVRRALAGAGTTVLVAVTPCVLGEARQAPLAIHAARCNRCGACLGLGCPAISDVGAEAMVVDPAACTGCGLCAPLCRARAIGPALAVIGG